jgi:hypothetical protein
MTEKLKSLTQAHSRFVLLLQSLVHSSSAPVSPEPEDFGLKFVSSKPSLRELTFPAPLSLSNEINDRVVPETMDALPPLRGHKRYSSLGSRLFRPSSPSLRRSETLIGRSQSSPDSSLSAMSNNHVMPRRVSIFRKATPLPPPSSEPRSLKFYSATWRRNSRSISAGGGPMWDDDFGMRLPHRRFASVNASTISSLSPSTPTPYFRNSIELAMSCSSPHDLPLAVSRTRAPILRVFVPCSYMDEGVIAECEEQLMDSGLWGHLSAGDIICNLGFIPHALDDTGADSNEPVLGMEWDTSGKTTSRKWLIFNGYCLVRFSPPEPPPVNDPLTLPSPSYYSHILSPFSNQIYSLTLPPSYFDDVPQMTLVYTSSKVKSPHSPAGYATVKKYMWVARVMSLAWSDFSRFGEGEAIGQGWKGEWVLEGEGTREGRQILIDCIGGCETEKRDWEFVREKSGGGRIWLK